MQAGHPDASAKFQHFVPSFPESPPRPRRAFPYLAITGAIAITVAITGLFARLMSFPLRHDGQMYLPVGTLDPAGLYRDYGFNNLPALPLLLHAVYAATGTGHFLLTGRLVTFAMWIVALLGIALIAWRATRSRVAVLAAVLLLATNPLLLGPAGMLVTNNFAPIAFGLAGIALFLVGSDGAGPRPFVIFGSGVCLGLAVAFKANAIFLLPPVALAALLVPGLRRVRWVLLPLVVGGVVGASPVLAYLYQDPQGFLVHVLGYHRGPHIAYWTSNADLDGRKILALGDKLRFAARLWFTGATGLIFLGLAVSLWAAVRARAWRWPVLVGSGLLAGAMLVSFVPTPAFPQYYAAPIPFAIVLIALIYGELDTRRLAGVGPILGACALLAVLIGAPRPLLALPKLVRPSEWTGIRVHDAAQAMARLVPDQARGGRLATLSPIYALEAGFQLYPELACGPLVYRVGDLISPADRRHYRLISPTTVDAVLDEDPPAAVLVGFEGELDKGFVRYARSRGFRAVSVPEMRDRYGQGVLFVRTAQPRPAESRSS